MPRHKKTTTVALVSQGASVANATGAVVKRNKKKKNQKKKLPGVTLDVEKQLVLPRGRYPDKQGITGTISGARGALGERARSRTGLGRKAGTISDAKVLSEFKQDAHLYGDSLLMPELHLPAKVWDNNMQPTIVSHTEWEIDLPVATPAGGSPTFETFGFAFSPSAVKGTYYYLTNTTGASEDGFTWSAAQDAPSAIYNPITESFLNGRVVSRAAHVMDLTAALYKGGRWTCCRYFSNQWAAGAQLPASLSELTATPAAETFPNRDVDLGARGTYFPQNPTNGSGFTATNVQSTTGGWFVCILRRPLASVSGNDVRVRMYDNLELTPFQDEFFLFEPSVDVGDVSMTAMVVAETGGLLASLGTSLNSFAEYLDSSSFRNLVSKGISVGKLLASLWASGAAGLGAEVQRIKARLDGSLNRLRQFPDPPPALSALLRTLECAAVQADDLLVSLRGTTDDFVPVRGDYRTLAEPPSPSPSMPTLQQRGPRAPSGRA